MLTHKHTIPGICYEIFVRSFCDSNGDGIGDLKGIISKLDYLQDLGVGAIWLTPVHPSPSYHKYDVRDYYDIDPEFGSLTDFRLLVQTAHEKGIAVYLDLIVNHTSTEHPWFQKASHSKQNFWRNFYWWKSPEEIDLLGIAKRKTTDDSQEVYPWHENGSDSEKYYGMFYKGMPDLNYNSADLRKAIAKIIGFWLNDIGVDGFRLDAARHIYPDWEKSKNLPFWNFFNETVRNINANAFTVGEVWAESDEVAPYFQYLNASFNFDLSLALQRILIAEKDEDLIDQLIANHALFSTYNPDFIDAIMLTNHDQERIGSVVLNNELKKKLAASIILTLPGQSYIYYGEEIGMLGRKPDHDIREPFLWSDDPDAKDQTRWAKAKYSVPPDVIPLSAQTEDVSSLYNHYKTLIALKKTNPVLANITGSNLARYSFQDDELLSYIRTGENEELLIVHNLSAKVKTLNLTSSGFRHVLFESIKSKYDERYQLPEYASVIFSGKRINKDK